MTVYVHTHFPKVVYSQENILGVSVTSQEQLDQLEGEWYESPADIPGEEIQVEAVETIPVKRKRK